MMNVMKKDYPPDFVPVWATDDLSRVTERIHGDKEEFDNKEIPYFNIVAGNAKSDCPLPCKSTKIMSVFLDEKSEPKNTSKIDIAFSDTLTITTSDFPKFNPAEFLSTLGGSMGLWLGLGVVQTIEIVLNAILKRVK